MPYQHTNRRGDVYFLHQGKTKTGKPKWQFSMKETGDPVDSIPAGYEVYESPNGQVFLRQEQPKLIHPDEIALVENGIRKLAQLTYFLVEAKGKDIIIHLPNQDTDFLESGLFLGFGAGLRTSPARLQRFLSYSPMMRFALVDDQARTFCAYRWCFRGSIDDWFPLSASGELSSLVKKFVRHLGKESFFELM